MRAGWRHSERSAWWCHSLVIASSRFSRNSGHGGPGRQFGLAESVGGCEQGAVFARQFRWVQLSVLDALPLPVQEVSSSSLSVSAGIRARTRLKAYSMRSGSLDPPSPSTRRPSSCAASMKTVSFSVTRACSGVFERSRFTHAKIPDRRVESGQDGVGNGTVAECVQRPAIALPVLGNVPPLRTVAGWREEQEFRRGRVDGRAADFPP